VSLTPFELQQRRKILFPQSIWPVPNKSYGVQKPFAFERQQVFAIALGGYPWAQHETAFRMATPRATMALAPLEFQQCCKAPFPNKVSPVPNKTYRVKAFFLFYRYIVFAITLCNYLTAQLELAFHMMVRRATVTFSPAKFR